MEARLIPLRAPLCAGSLLTNNRPDSWCYSTVSYLMISVTMLTMFGNTCILPRVDYALAMRKAVTVHHLQRITRWLLFQQQLEGRVNRSRVCAKSQYTELFNVTANNPSSHLSYLSKLAVVTCPYEKPRQSICPRGIFLTISW